MKKETFELKVAKGSYMLKVEFLSYKTYEKEINVAESTFDLGVIELSLSEQSLDEVIVRAEKSDVNLKIDKKVFNVGKDIISQNVSLQQVLENVPSVSVDINGEVSLRGNSNVSILINGKPSILATNNNINQIPASQIERVEVITNPSSRYQASGTAGIINVILKRNARSGFSGRVSIMNSIRANTNVNGSINYKTKKLNLFTSLGYRFIDERITESVFQNLTFDQSSSSLERYSQEYLNTKAASIYAGFDYYLSKNSTLTASYYKILIERNINPRFKFDYFNTLQSLDSTIVRNEEYYEPMDHNQLEIGYTKNFQKKGKKLVIDFQYDFWKDDENEDISTQTTFPIPQNSIVSRTKDIENSQDLLLQIDFINPLNESSSFEAGIRGETRIISSDYKAEIFQNNQWDIFNNIDNKMDYREQIIGAYALFANKSKKMSYQLGLRTEYTKIDISDRNNQFGSVKNYTRFFPTLHLNYAFSDVNSIQLSYSRRINRPSFWQLNPFSTLTGGLNAIIQGNPDLDPAYTNSLELSYLAKIAKFQINPSLYYQNTSNPFQFFTQRNANDILISTTVNIDGEKRYGLELSLIYKPYKWLQLSNDFNYYYFNQEGNFQDYNFNFNNSTWTNRINTRVKLPKEFTFQANYSYEAKNENAQAITKPFYFVNLGINKQLFKNKATIAFNIRNLLNSRERRILRTGEDFSYQSFRIDLGPIYSLNFTYRFNQKENTRVRRPGRSNR